MTKIIHVNQGNIRSNAKHGKSLPVCRVQCGSKTRYGDQIVIHGPSRMVYSGDNPLACGARVWIETEADVDVIDERPWNKEKHD